ncbi:MAG: hypothetical protein E6Q70_07030 [Pseudomonas monteilii]|nr:MAG: hypothetical protein E6Q70_07030 [Pseudomonas monteilii]
MQKTLKTVMWWVVGTVAAVPLTKLVESYFDVSFFTPAIMKLWGWIQSAWGWLGSDVSLPVWVSLLLCLGSLLSVVLVGVLVYIQWFEEGEKTPKGVPLTADQLTAFMAISKAIQGGQMLTGDDVRRKTGLSRIATDAALDHLYGIGLIEPHHGAYHHKYAGLSHFGRAYYLELEKLHGCEAAR